MLTGWKLWVLRLVVVVAIPFLILAVVGHRLWIEASGIPFYVWCDMRAEWRSLRRAWRGVADFRGIRG